MFATNYHAYAEIPISKKLIIKSLKLVLYGTSLPHFRMNSDLESYALHFDLNRLHGNAGVPTYGERNAFLLTKIKLPCNKERRADSLDQA